MIQYVDPGSRGKIIILNISPKSELHELKFCLKTVFMFLVITVKWQLSRQHILLLIRKKLAVLKGPWSANVALGRESYKQHKDPDNFQKIIKI